MTLLTTNKKWHVMWFNIKIVSALFEQCVLEMIMKLSTSNLLKMYSLNVKKMCVPSTKNKHIGILFLKVT